MKKYLLYPFDNSDLKNNIFNGPFVFLRDYLKKVGVDLQTYDMDDISSADKIIFFNHQPTHLNRCLKLGRDKKDLILFLFEPEVVMPEQYLQSTWKYYAKIFTYRDDLVDGKVFIKMLWPQGQMMRDSLPAFNKRGFLTLINANKYSYINNELYSFRRRAIRYFEKNEKNFDLFGYGWSQNNAIRLSTALSALKTFKILEYGADIIDSLKPYKSYRGIIHDKYSTLEKYRFCLCFENEKKVIGWISEKIFDCFFSGTIPVYLGAENIDAYIPSECYIDMRKFKDFNKLDSYLKTMNETTFTKIQQAGHDFISGNLFAKWKPENVCREIVSAL